MNVSPAFRQAAPPNETQKLLLVLLAVFLAPLPIYLLTGPKYTIRTKEFLISFLLMLLVPFGGFLYSLYFICVGLPHALAHGEGYVRLNNDLESSAILPENDAPAPQAPAKPTSAEPEHYNAPLPSYEEVEGSSNGASSQFPVDVKGDNKVQH